jgi:hypothetical protein
MAVLPAAVEVEVGDRELVATLRASPLVHELHCTT